MTEKGRCETPLLKNKAFYDMLEGREKKSYELFCDSCRQIYRMYPIASALNLFYFSENLYNLCPLCIFAPNKIWKYIMNTH